MPSSKPTTITTDDETTLYELGDTFVTKVEYDEYQAAETAALGTEDPS